MSKNSLSSGAMYVTLSSLIFMFSAYIIHMWLGRSLGPAEYGIYGVVINLMTFVNLTQTTGLPQSVAKYVSTYPDKIDSVLKSGLIIQIISTIAISTIYALCAPVFATLLNDPSLTPYIQASALIIPFYGIYTLYTGYYNGIHDFKRQSLMITIYSLVKIAGVIGMMHLFKLYGAIVGFTIAPLVVLFFGFKLPLLKTKVFPYKSLILFAIPLVGFAVFSTLSQAIDLFLLKSILQSNESSGYYTAAQNIARIIYFAFSSLSIVLFPGIAKLMGEKNHIKAKELLSESIRITVLLIFPAAALLSATSDSLIKLIYSESYAPAAPALSILAIAMGFFTLYTILANCISGAGSPVKACIIAFIGLCITTLCSMVLIPEYGMTGAAVATTIGCGAAALVAAGVLYKQFHVYLPFSSLAKIVLSSVCIYFVSLFLTTHPILLPITYVLSGIVYISLLVVTKELSSKDRKYFYPYLKKFIQK